MKTPLNKSTPPLTTLAIAKMGAAARWKGMSLAKRKDAMAKPLAALKKARAARARAAKKSVTE